MGRKGGVGCSRWSEQVGQSSLRREIFLVAYVSEMRLKIYFADGDDI